jgi:FAD dependent oxidoreductase TIGR03364
MQGFDLVVVGAGVVGLAHAYEAARRGLKVAVVDRDHRCVGASIRNFGFITVTGQRAGDTWRRARYSRDVWAEVAASAGIPVLHQGLWVLAHHRQSMPVIEAFAATDMGEHCRVYAASEAAALAPWLRTDHAAGALYSPHELRVESRTAIPMLTRWLEAVHGVTFVWGHEVLRWALGPDGGVRVEAATLSLQAERVVVCPGTELNGVAAPVLRAHGLALTRLQMLRVQPEPGFRMSAAAMSDLSLVRYRGYADLPEAEALRTFMRSEEPECLDHGIHLIAVQSADGSLVVGDSHHDDMSPEPFASDAVDQLILTQLRATLDLARCQVTERWVGVYPTGAAVDCLIEAPEPQVRVVLVTSGTGASTAFGIAHDVFSRW